MGNVLKKVRDEVPDSFFRFNIFLPADMAKPALDFCITIEAVLFLSFLKMAHGALILLKIIKFTGLWVIGII
jgi:hypothetical protein